MTKHGSIPEPTFEDIPPATPSDNETKNDAAHGQSAPAAEPSSPPPPSEPLKSAPAERGSTPKVSTPPLSWWQFMQSQPTDAAIQKRAIAEFKIIIEKHKLHETYCVLSLLEPDYSINGFDLDKIYEALNRSNPKHDKDVLLVLLSRGGDIEPAYQISKLCKTFAREKFIVVVPRQAKSAATLIA